MIDERKCSRVNVTEGVFFAKGSEVAKVKYIVLQYTFQKNQVLN